MHWDPGWCGKLDFLEKIDEDRVRSNSYEIIAYLIQQWLRIRQLPSAECEDRGALKIVVPLLHQFLLHHQRLRSSTGQV
jgi:hypothetical protein